VDTAVEKMIETVSRQRITASETTHDGEKWIQTVTTEKCWKRVCRGKKLGEAVILFVFFFIWVRRVLRSVITVYVPLCLFFLKYRASKPWANNLGRSCLGQRRSARPQTRSALGRDSRARQRSTPDALCAGARQVLFFCVR
jgi:hypothetical protein